MRSDKGNFSQQNRQSMFYRGCGNLQLMGGRLQALVSSECHPYKHQQKTLYRIPTRTCVRLPMMCSNFERTCKFRAYGSHVQQNNVGQINVLTVEFPFLRLKSLYRYSYMARFAVTTQNPLTRPKTWSYEKVRDVDT